MTRTAIFEHEVINEATGKVHHFRGFGWNNYEEDIIVGIYEEVNQSFACNREELLKCQTLKEAKMVVKFPNTYFYEYKNHLIKLRRRVGNYDPDIYQVLNKGSATPIAIFKKFSEAKKYIDNYD